MNNHFPANILLSIAVLLGLSFASAQPLTGALLRHRVSTAPNSAASGCTPHYVVRSGDTLSAIARRCGVSTSGLAQANGLRLSSVIYPGQRLVMPGATTSSSTTTSSAITTSTASTNSQAAAGCSRRYTVRAGDTLGAIASRCGVSVTSLKQWNGLRSDLIWVGQVLDTRSPGSAAVSAPVATQAAGYTSGVSSAVYMPATPTPYWPPTPLPAAQSTPTPSIESTVSPW